MVMGFGGALRGEVLERLDGVWQRVPVVEQRDGYVVRDRRSRSAPATNTQSSEVEMTK